LMVMSSVWWWCQEFEDFNKCQWFQQVLGNYDLAKYWWTPM